MFWTIINRVALVLNLVALIGAMFVAFKIRQVLKLSPQQMGIIVQNENAYVQQFNKR